MSNPYFIIIGAPRSGTTSLAKYLGQHPEIFISPIKEPHFFAFKNRDIDFEGPRDQETMKRYVVQEWEQYQSLFREADSEQRTGEVSAMYLYSEKAARRINEYIPDVKLIAILRNPVDRAYSHYLRMRREGREPLETFEEAIEAESRRIEENWAWPWHYTRMGYYYRQMCRYLSVFDRSSIKVYKFNSLKNNTNKTLREIQKYLGVKLKEYKSSKRYNISGLPKSKITHKVMEGRFFMKDILKKIIPSRVRTKLKRKIRKVNLEKPEMSKETRARLYKEFKRDIEKLEDIIDKDLSDWKEEA